MTAEFHGAAATVYELASYPIKGLSPQTVASVALKTGRGFPYDREWALARPGGEYRPGNGKAIHKSNFFVLLKEDRLAGITTNLDVHSRVLRSRYASTSSYTKTWRRGRVYERSSASSREY